MAPEKTDAGGVVVNNGYLFFAWAVLAQSFAQILQKKGITQLGGLGEIFSNMGKAFSNYYLVCGILLSVAGMIMWLGALSRFKLSFLYSFGAISYVVVCLMAMWLLGESISAIRWGGIALIIAGCVMINL